MFTCDFDEKIIQTLPGQGWRVLIEWCPEPQDSADGHPALTLEPVIAWVSARIQRERKRDGYRYDDVSIVALVRGPWGSADLMLLDGRADYRSFKSFTYLAPGEKISESHLKRLHGGYAEAVTLG
jgi:hypothetical protein